MGDETYGPRFVIVGSQTAIKKPVIAPKPNLPKRTPSRADNARRWAPAAYNRNYAEAKRHQVVAEQTATQPPPPGTVLNKSLTLKIISLRFFDKLKEINFLSITIKGRMSLWWMFL